MTDRELLEAAARAAGIELVWLDDVKPGYFDGDASLWRDWNPLRSDGDAFRLAVKLGMDVRQLLGINEVHVYMGVGMTWEPFGCDPYAATRRAVVRAAASLWKGAE